MTTVSLNCSFGVEGMAPLARPFPRDSADYLHVTVFFGSLRAWGAFLLTEFFFYRSRHPLGMSGRGHATPRGHQPKDWAQWPIPNEVSALWSRRKDRHQPENWKGWVQWTWEGSSSSRHQAPIGGPRISPISPLAYLRAGKLPRHVLFWWILFWSLVPRRAVGLLCLRGADGCTISSRP